MISTLTTKAYISVTEAFRRFKQNEKGVTAIEYGLIAVAVAAMIVVVFYNDNGFIGELKKKFAELATKVTSAQLNGKQ
ncbi:pilus assembly protein Flp/PilA [Cricetibacter osteomyelitidis]|uniref:Pilus assembly protein Flp/PilA n=1 Tax=Cricetibacter osteomyelitidis TaxID=1521931 RepID=A0A4R2T057_9PAST|nr:Flp family type IVb pilin [Cricetibacter osteomyelitidis]TCP94651.1 pilus assembly protein Flp/PilA [Cricetibacter osteomyelitidis]